MVLDAPETTISLVVIKIFLGETPKPPGKGIYPPAGPFCDAGTTRESAPNLFGPPGPNFLDPPLAKRICCGHPC